MNTGLRFASTSGLGLLLGLGLALGACSSDDDSSGSGSGATGGGAGADSGGSGGLGAGGSGVGASGGSAGDDGSGGGGSGNGGSTSVGGTGGTAATGGTGGTAATGGTGADTTGGTGGGAGCGDCDGVCDPQTNTCVECTPANDTCDSGYCSAANECVLGCNADDQCASGSCSSTNDCDSCVADTECAGGSVCGSGECASECSGEGTECGSGGTCCSEHCVDVERDINHCGGCGIACELDEFCTSDAEVECTSAVFSNVCRHATATALRDGASIDDAASASILAALVANCAPAPAERNPPQDTDDALNGTTGQPVVGPGELLIAAGGGFFNLLSDYLSTSRTAPIYDVGGTVDAEFRLSANDEQVASVPLSSVEDGSHDLIVIQLARDPLTGTLALNAYGFHAVGTSAAAWYFANQMSADLASYTDSWYVYEWTDDAADGPTAADEFVLRGSG